MIFEIKTLVNNFILLHVTAMVLPYKSLDLHIRKF